MLLGRWGVQLQVWPWEGCSSGLSPSICMAKRAHALTQSCTPTQAPPFGGYTGVSAEVFLSTLTQYFSTPSPSQSLTWLTGAFCLELLGTKKFPSICAASSWHYLCCSGGKNRTPGNPEPWGVPPFSTFLYCCSKRIKAGFTFALTYYPDWPRGHLIDCMAATGFWTQSVPQNCTWIETASISSPRVRRGNVTLPTWHMLVAAMSGN